MLIDWTKFIAAVLLLVPPVALLHGKRVRYRALMRDWDGYWRRTLAHGTHTIDLVRAILGGWLLVDAFAEMTAVTGPMRHVPLLLQAAVLGVAIVAQTLVCKEEDAANAPFTFVAGLAFGFLVPLLPGWAPFATAGFAVVLATVVSYGAREPAVFFPLLAAALAAAGYLFTRMKLMLPLAVLCPIVVMPWLLTLLFPRHFVVSYLARRADAASAFATPRK